MTENRFYAANRRNASAREHKINCYIKFDIEMKPVYAYLFGPMIAWCVNIEKKLLTSVHDSYNVEHSKDK